MVADLAPLPPRPKRALVGFEAAADAATLITLALTLLSLSRFPALIDTARALLIVVTIVRVGAGEGRVRFSVVDYIVPGIAALYIGWFAFGPFRPGVARISDLYTAILVYQVTRRLRHSRLALPITAGFIAIGSGWLSVEWIQGCRDWIRALHQAGFSDVPALKASMISPLHGPINEWATDLLISASLLLTALSPVRNGFVRRNLLPIVALPLICCALFLTFSRGAYLALAVLAASVITGTCVLRFSRKVRGFIITILLSGCILGGGLADYFSGDGVRRTAMVAATEQQRRSSRGRIQVWNTALRMVQAHPIFGTGPGTFAMRFVPNAGLDEGRSFVGRPLNTWLGILNELGAVGLLLHVALIAAALWSAGRQMLATRDARGLPALALGAGILAFWARETTFSSLLESPLVASLFFFWIGLLTALTHRTRRGTSAASKWPAVTLGIVAASGAPIFIAAAKLRRAEVPALSAAAALAQGNYSAAQARIEEALVMTANPYYRSILAFSTALANGVQFDRSQVPDTAMLRVQVDKERRKNLHAAFNWYTEAIRQNPDDDLFYYNRAWIRISLGEPIGAAIRDFERAAAIDGSVPVYRISLGIAYGNDGKADWRTGEFAQALATSPSLADSAFARDLAAHDEATWRACLSEAIRLLESRNRSDVEADARLARLYLERGDPEISRQVLERVVRQLPQLPRAWANLGRALVEEKKFSLSAKALQKAAFLAPRDPATRAAQGRLANALGDEEAADLFARRGVGGEGYRSDHASRAERVYKTHAIVGDDILPGGFLEYCSPQAEGTERTPR